MAEKKNIFVFGSNLAGVHGAGAAGTAYKRFGALMGQGIGFQGSSYAIPTKDENLRTLPLMDVKHYVNEFLTFAKDHPTWTFMVTKIGTGLAGYSDIHIAPMFMYAPTNCVFDQGWERYIGKNYKYHKGDL